MISKTTLVEAIEYLVQQEARLVELYSSGVEHGGDAETVDFYHGTLKDFLGVRAHIYDLIAGSSEPSEFLQNMTGPELVNHFAQVDES